jgi:hypothetical protein
MSFDANLNKRMEEGNDRGVRDEADESVDDLNPEPALEAVLRDFRSSVQAWSEAVYTRPRPVIQSSRGRVWRKAAAWTLGCMLAAAAGGGGYLQRQHRQEMARIAAAREAAHQRQIAEQRAREAEEELARVDSAIERQVPNAMEPLAQLMTEDESQ